MSKNKHQDYIYLKKYKKPKENFVFLKDIVLNFKPKSKISILDMGCAAGDWFYYLDTVFKDCSFVGVDYSESLIAEAKKKVFLSNASFYKSKAENFNKIKNFDIINIAGVISYYDDPEKLIKNCFKLLKKNGILIIFDNFNDHDIDVLVKYRDNEKTSKFNHGWNIHSKKTIKRICKNCKLYFKRKYQFNLSFDLKKKIDGARSWTINTNEGKMFRNGLAQIYNLDSFVFKK